MALYATDVEWHSLQIDPDDLPEEDEPVMVTVESVLGGRQVWLDAFIKEDELGNPAFFTKIHGEYGHSIEDQKIWYKVVAWAYPPAPFEYF